MNGNGRTKRLCGQIALFPVSVPLNRRIYGADADPPQFNMVDVLTGTNPTGGL
jgi:hypothetical protein